MFREIMAIRTFQMMMSRSLICLLENQNGGKLQKMPIVTPKWKKLIINGSSGLTFVFKNHNSFIE
jgi:hypothetical protein